jgi:hypothetical protein
MLGTTLKGMERDPFAPVVYELRVPLRKGEVEYKELTLRPPEVGDILMTDGHPPESVAYALALLASLSGVPLIFLKTMVPEDYADLRVILALTNMRFMGQINLLDGKEEGKEGGAGDPTEAEEKAEDTPPPASAPTSAA